MEQRRLEKITADLKEKYPEAGIRKIEVDESSGKSTFFLRPSQKALATLPPELAMRLRMSESEKASVLRRDWLTRSDLDLSIAESPSTQDPKESYKRSMRYYYDFDMYGTHIDILTNFAAKGFENDIDDKKIKQFYDVWNFDVNFKQVLDWIFFDFFRVGMVRTYKIIGKYNPGVSYLSPIPGMKQARGDLKEIVERAERIHQKRLERLDEKLKDLDGRRKDEKDLKRELSARKKIWSKGFMPIAYTVLNPTLVDIEGSLLFNNTKVTLKPSEELVKLTKKAPTELTDDEKTLIKLLPSDFKEKVKSGKGIELDPMYVGEVDYRKQPYERYARPRGIKVFDALEYKKSLRQADLSTLDGITNYILKVTIGNDEYPVTSQSELQTIASLFNSTTSKSFDVVWNHTLQIEKIVAPEIEAVLGQDKYKQVNEDITGGLAMSRGFIDGVTNLNTGEANLVTKTVLEEINYARRQVERWIYNEYRQIAEAMGFDRFPRVRWDNTILRDIILYMSTISALVDRRMLSYETALEQLGFDYENEFGNMKNELPSVLEGILGIVGSPFQQKGSGIQNVQRAPIGTPSNGRPRGQVPKTKQPSTKPQTKTKVPNQAPSQQPGPSPAAASTDIRYVMQYAAEVMDNDQFLEFLQGFIESYRTTE